MKMEMLGTYRHVSQPELTNEEMQAMHDEIKDNIGVDYLNPGQLHCSKHDKTHN
jgi:hypothetical protein